MSEHYEKDFDAWNEQKKITDNKEVTDTFYYKEREIWWSSLGVNIGCEIDGKNENFERPILVIKKVNKHQFFGIPLTSQNKEGFFYEKVNYSDGGVGTINLSQIRVLSTKRIIRKIGMVDLTDFERVKDKFTDYFNQTKKSDPA
ncbi:MAG TPA: type II toxin-antitoxin system PemK/MazF family toxin [Aequorivita sp.]|nr:type II toxin-antitoxin system PemK/MazF family toxin [Aequorivita sp.]